ncbi:3-hydroxyisobutyrate dehydrogenase-like beta-hydroxyacid dehydrogenase [Novosphingobium sp. PhB165]|uniref:NAD(P)-dependent oxidoreductase n=1 Tax=Novosphingobium sp. PhB165 TaxID=2485105 RepID=UPI0010E26B6B|nr:NAD(P)-dependent oxidoreductase [Novosphingobium sp. PhB165]TCM16589.1 3-hydroxyisobutyrate dehydrogenase-like beta-hydroxyacid dehydrogenase [Novosphingobium sp. PhB165]
MKIGFIGLGSMGAPIARRLARSGFAVTGCDVSPEALAAFDEPGTTCEADPIETAHGADILGICVRTDAQLEALCREDAIFRALGPDKLVILNSTVAPDLARELARRASQQGVGFIDVGVSGGGPKALEGKLSLFVGGDEADVAKGRPFLDAIGTLAHLGPVGRGLEGKLLNNLVSIAYYGMAASILDLGVSLDFDREQLRQALMLGSAQGFALQAVPGLLGWRGNADAAYLDDMHDLLAKDVLHARDLSSPDDTAMTALQAACQVMLDRVIRAADEQR